MDRRNLTLLALAATLAALAGAPRSAAAQGIGGRLRRAAAGAAEAATRKAEEATQAAVEGAAAARTDESEDEASATSAPAARGARPAATPTATPGSKPARSANAAPDGDAGKSAATDTADVPRTTNAGKDFTPGTRVLYATDFARDEIGDFPRAFQLKSGNAEVAEIGGARYLRATSFGAFEVPLPETLPERFTIEFDFTGSGGWYQQLWFVGKAQQESAHRIELRPTDGGIRGPDDYDVSADAPGTRAGVPFRVQIMADGEYVKVYMNGARVANAPNAKLGRSRALRFQISADTDEPVLLGNLRIAAGGKDLYAALEASGRVTADGVLFDTNSDRIRPESAPVLRAIADMLAAHPSLQLAIEGHTDDVGSAAKNQSLSADRAAAVKRYLVATHGVAAARLATAGFGATRPVAANDSEANRQRNRRVELVKR